MSGVRSYQGVLVTCDEPALKEYVMQLADSKAIQGLSFVEEVDETRVFVEFGRADVDYAAELQERLDQWHDKNTFHAHADGEAEAGAAKKAKAAKERRLRRQRKANEAAKRGKKERAAARGGGVEEEEEEDDEDML